MDPSWQNPLTTASRMRPLLLLPFAAALALAGCAATAPPDQTRPPGPAAVSTSPRPYAGLSSEIRATIEAGFYEPAALASPNWQRFFARLDAGMAAATTDAEARAAFAAAQPEAGVSHLSLSKESTLPSGPPGTRPPVSFDVRGGVAVLDIRSFNGSVAAAPIVDAFQAMALDPPRALIIDVRGNGGGDISSMLVAGHLIEAPAPVGLFVSRQFWATHDAVPPPAEWSSLPLLRSLDQNAFFEALSTEGALVGIVPPMTPRYAGPVYLLTDGGTGSACEPLAYVLKQTGRATLVGEKTAGQMLSGSMVKLSDGWTLQLPVADYYVPDGTRLDGVGVTPDVSVPSAEAMSEALRRATVG